MSMHILPAFYTTTVSKRRLSHKSKAKSKLVSDHDRWLLSKGLHPDQIKMKKGVDGNWKKRYTDDMMVDRSTRSYDDKKLVAGDCSKRDIMTNLHKEPEHVQKEILDKAKRTAPLYSKGPYQFITDGSNLKEIGKKL